MEDARTVRNPDHDINDLFVKRWSPRAMSGDALNEDTMKQLLEAARWAPSSYNGQPWRFFYALQDDEAFDTYFDCLGEFNQSWCDNAGALLVIADTGRFSHNEEDDGTSEMTTGAAFENLSLQGADMDLVVHAMAGFDADQAESELGMPDHFNALCMVAIGHPGDPSYLPDGLAEREEPSDRMHLDEISYQGSYEG